jgi:hypothetical protein
MMGIIVTFFVGRAVRISLCSLDTASQAREPDHDASPSMDSLRPSRYILYRRSIGSTSFYISSKRHPISPFRISSCAHQSVATSLSQSQPLVEPLALARYT